MSDREARPRRLASVDAVRAHQRQWLEDTRARVAAGDHFAICNADDFEEIFTAFDIPALVINYWNSVVTFSAKKGDHFAAVLDAHGYEPSNFGLGFATTLAPEEAPWGGLPKPTLIVGTTRDEAQLRVTELWAEAFGCECYPLDFSWTSQFSRMLPPEWWTLHRDRSEEMVDPRRLDLRLAQMKGLIAWLERKLDRRFDWVRFADIMRRLNQQMDIWREAMDLIAAARPLPVSLREQMAMYQVTWQRGTERNLALVEDFLAEVRETISAGVAAHPEERFRVYMATSGNDPQFHAYLRERWGGVIVSNRYSSIAPMYARSFSDDPLRALASRQLFLFDKEPRWEAHEARRWGADAVIALQPEDAVDTHYERVIEDAGFAFLALPRDADTADIRARIDAFVEQRLRRHCSSLN